jgi:hypothetical protein
MATPSFGRLCPAMTTVDTSGWRAGRRWHGKSWIAAILDSFAPARHKFGHWRGRFGPRELLRR